jgi:PhnO protein
LCSGIYPASKSRTLHSRGTLAAKIKKTNFPENYKMVRQAAFEDLNFIDEFICQLEDFQLDFESFRAIFDNNIINPNLIYLVAFQNDRIVRFISCHTQKLLHHCSIVGEIQELYVDNEFRNMGFGRLLILEIIKIAKTNDFKSLEVTSNIMRTENVGIYKQYGFQLTHNKFTMSL